MALDPRIEVIREKYGLDKADFWELPQKKGTWLVKHAALEMAAAQAGIVFEPPMILEAKGSEGTAAVCVTGHLGDRAIWSIGEASPKNSRNAYPWAMAEKRAIDRVVLKLIGIHGLVYSEDEMSDADDRARNFDTDPPPKVLVKDQRVIWGELRDEIDKCSTVDELASLWISKPFQNDMKKLKESWQTLLVEHKDGHKADLMGGPVRQRVEPDFSGMERAQ